MQNRSSHARKTGGWGEGEAIRFLVTNGVKIIGRNIHTQFGEIDILGLDNEILVFFEVKTRLSRKFGYPEIAVGKNKASHMVNSALDYLQNHPEVENEWRIDVVSITKYRDTPQEIKWFRNAITG
jgi:putative endonuclease